MKTYTLLSIFVSVFLIYESEGELFDPAPPAPPRHFQFITMDLVHRGSYNTTDCVKELLNCWEIVKSDILCSSSTFESVCGLIRSQCDDTVGWKNTYYNIPLFESLCKRDWQEMWT